MTEIRVTALSDGEYSVEVHEGVGSTTHRVTVSPDELERFGAGADARALVRESFAFLLEREPKESILGSFGLSVIERYFPEYPDAIRRRLEAVEEKESMGREGLEPPTSAM
jgi:hypothetical protein